MAPPHPPPEGPPHSPPHWAGLDQMKDEEVLRFAPPEIRRLWKRLISVEEQVADVQATLKRIEELLRARPGAT